MSVTEGKVGAAPAPATIDADVVVNESDGALRQITEGEINMQVVTAKRFPRSLAKFKNTLTEMVRLNRNVAESAYYVLPRDGKRLTGPSIRLAEMAVSAYGNCRLAGRVIDTGATDITLEGVAFDMESNTAWYVQSKRRITTKDGRRYSDDMIVTTTNAGISIVLRNATLRMIPRALIDEALTTAKQVVAGEIKDITSTRKAAIAKCEKLGVKRDQVFAFLEVAGEDDITVNHLLDLAGALNAIQDGEATVAETFPVTDPDKAGARKFGKDAIKTPDAQPGPVAPATDTAPTA